MASDQNLIKGGFSGRLGEMYGVQFRGKQVLRAIPFSRAPQKEAQKNNQLAFQCLVRLASGVARCNFTNLGINASKFTKINAVTKAWRVIIKNKAFEPQNLIPHFPSTNQLHISAFNYDYSTQIVDLSYDFLPGFFPASDCVVYCIIFNNLGHCIYTACTSPDKNQHTFSMSISSSESYSFLAFVSTLQNKSYTLSNFCLQNGFISH